MRISPFQISGHAPEVYAWNEYIIANILCIFCNLRSCGYGHAVIITDNGDIARDATLQRNILEQRGISLRLVTQGLLRTFLKYKLPK